MNEAIGHEHGNVEVQVSRNLPGAAIETRRWVHPTQRVRYEPPPNKRAQGFLTFPPPR
ncbi:MAG: hypothetical protein JO069_14985 [Verrucomicrobia bacterium]|nr:hypothetical protein [Verrucomicrobiota bacterium]